MPKTETKNMMLITSSHLGNLTINMIPITENCPFVECIYLPKEKELVVISKLVKDTFHFMPRIDSNGDVEIAKKRNNGSTIKEERKQIKTYYEYNIKDAQDIESFIELFAINSASFDYKALMNIIPV